MVKTLSIIIPCYNESATITQILDKVIEVNLIEGVLKEFIIVNDASSDDTEDKIRTFFKSHNNLKWQ